MSHTRWAKGAPDDIDEVVVDRLVNQERVTGATIWERRHAVRRLHQAGHTYREIIEIVGLASTRCVHDDLEWLTLDTQPGGRSRADRQVEVAAHAARGLCYIEIGHAVGAHYANVKRDCVALGIDASCATLGHIARHRESA